MQLRSLAVFLVNCIIVASHNVGATSADVIKRVDKRDSSFATKKELLYFHDQPFTGMQFELFGNGALYRETEYLNGKKNGYEKLFSLDGVLRTQWNFKSGKKDGEQLAWFEDGSKRFRYNYKAGLLEGEQVEWHQNGIVFRRQVFHNGFESEKKISYVGGEIFTNYVKRNKRIYGIDGGALCFEKKKDGERQ